MKSEISHCDYPGYVVINSQNGGNVRSPSKGMMRRCKYSYFELKFSLQVIGKTNKILQGPETNKLQAHDMVKTLRSGEQEAHIQIYNYKASGQGFWNDLYVYGYVHENDLEGALPDYHVAFLKEVTVP